jgi:hypothetical protein
MCYSILKGLNSCFTWTPCLGYGHEWLIVSDVVQA